MRVLQNVYKRNALVLLEINKLSLGQHLSCEKFGVMLSLLFHHTTLNELLTDHPVAYCNRIFREPVVFLQLVMKNCTSDARTSAETNARARVLISP